MITLNTSVIVVPRELTLSLHEIAGPLYVGTWFACLFRRLRAQ